ncbi:MAG: cytochrome b [Alphaproteobacteria bacterium]|nr:MAG: cytochrome b [Alphaproteobacteria bacterium]
MQLRNDSERWGAISIVLHWLIAILVIGQWALGYAMDEFVKDLELKFNLFQLHKSFGFLIFVLVLGRLVWRLAQPVPVLPATMTPLERRLSALSHGGFYVILLAMPVAGWLAAATSKIVVPTRIFDLFTLPNPFGPNPALHEFAEEAHATLAWILLALLLLHVAAALKHHFRDRDDVLRRMLPLWPRTAR